MKVICKTKLDSVTASSSVAIFVVREGFSLSADLMPVKSLHVSLHPLGLRVYTHAMAAGQNKPAGKEEV